MYRHCINTSCTQGYICHLLVVRDARADFDIEFDVWRARQSRLRVRSGGLRLDGSEDASAASAVATVTTPEASTLTEVQRKQRWRQQLKEYETKFNKRRPRAMTHLAFRISVINSLVKRTLIVMRRRRSARQTVTPAAAAESSEEEVPAETRGPGRPPDVTAPVIPHRVADKRKVDMVSVVCGSNRDQRKRVRAVQRLLPKFKLHAGKGRKYDLYGAKAMARFKGEQCIPGMHVLKSMPGRCSFKCQICRALGENGKYGPKKNLKQPPRAKFTCTHPSCGGISLCSAECYNVWHFHPDVLST